jgi:hypothetical protein
LCLNPRRGLSPEPDVAVRQIGICAETFSFPDAAQKFGLTAAPMWQNRLDFHRILRLAVCVGRWTWLPTDPLRARPAICRASGRASVNSDAVNVILKSHKPQYVTGRRSALSKFKQTW